LAENNKGFDLISSPMPKPQLTSRVIANELPQTTYSPTAFDLPLRKDVIQTQIPASVTRTVETATDPRFPPKKAVTKVNASLYHGTGSTDAKVVYGVESSFLENKSGSKKNLKRNSKKINRENRYNIHSGKKCKCKNKDYVEEDAKLFKEEGLHHAKKAYEASDSILGSISDPTPHMILDVKTLNKKEQPDLKLYENNNYRKRRLQELKRTPAGVRAAHTIRRFG